MSFTNSLLILLLLLGTTNVLSAQHVSLNPAAPGFLASASDDFAIALADSVMHAMGGRTAWDQTRLLQWTFMGRRKLWWDKWTGDVRIESLDNSYQYIVNIHTRQGRARRNGFEYSEPDSLQYYLDQAVSIWINDSYWLCMPFKLKDDGVRLRYLGDSLLTTAGKPAYWIELTFQAVGDTPDNKYHVAVDKETYLVGEWQFFTRYDDPAPRFSTPWDQYARYGDIWLSGGRGSRSMLPITLDQQPDPRIFTEW
jgi:hypothetical protein